MLSILWKFLAITLFLTLIGLVVVFNKEITSFSDVNYVTQQGNHALDQENWRKATEIYEKGLKDHPEQVGFAMTLADLYHQQEQDDKAEALYQKLLEVDPRNLKARIAYARLLMQDSKRINEAVNLCRLALKKEGAKDSPQAGSNDPLLLTTLGDIFKQAADDPHEKRRKVKRWLYEWAIYYYRQALKADPSNFQARFNLGYAYQQVDNLEKSALEYCNAMMLSPDSYEVHYNMGIVLVELHAVDEGYRHLTRSIEILRDQDREQDARVLAEQVQAYKNTVFQNNLSGGLNQRNVPKVVDERCMITAPGPEASAHEK